MKIGIILGSTRDGRFGAAVAEWLNAIAQERGTEATYELLDLKDFDLPFFTDATPPMGLNKQYDNEKTQAWSDKIDAQDGFVFVSAEYNHSVPAAFKNAVDSLGPEWKEKPVLLAGYGWAGGVDAITAWKPVLNGFGMPEVAPALSFNLATEMVEGAFVPADGQRETAEQALAALEAALA
ncbi:NAD(P)H-dependent oxidoreductase [Corynebacterium sp. SCR221107]|uniref:NADPH-dependent FMN reductase n=1 Tax=Corynebacterium sp. SCR221107 TaxID=3017361 RepID=UPI0022EC6C1F|nr:NAD(P)H-dependent oxidoreductase [Corynebacterium sp. SCR221107]WBT08687.1 NAD(P)H-dependent oxidoreductase [Corynebacterium sp. SCR221107]